MSWEKMVEVYDKKIAIKREELKALERQRQEIIEEWHDEMKAALPVKVGDLVELTHGDLEYGDRKGDRWYVASIHSRLFSDHDFSHPSFSLSKSPDLKSCTSPFYLDDFRKVE